jgi:4-amino-4-deoxy-L-arabinose transferase-like glycosyltransferase
MKHLLKKKELLCIILIFLVFLFTRFYQLEERTEFRWDQVDNAWAAKDILIDGKLPLVGMVAKQNTGFYIGPLYYYFITPFYWVFNFDPIASAFIGRITSLFTFVILYIVTKKIFGKATALLSIFLYAVSFVIISADAYQWPINFIPIVSLLIFYFLYRVVSGNERDILPLAVFTGLSFHLNFTAVFFPIIILLSMPFFPRTKKTLKYLLIGLLLFMLFLVPNILYEFQNKGTSTSHMFSYIDSYYHGFHLRRFFQLTSLAFIEYKAFFSVFSAEWLGFLVLPLFSLSLWFSHISKKYLLIFLNILWIVVPWGVFSLYTGEITNYYFSLSVLIVLVSVAFIIVTLLQSKNLILRIGAVLLVILFAYANINKFFSFGLQGINYHKDQVRQAIDAGKKINFTQGDPQSFIYYIYKERLEK